MFKAEASTNQPAPKEVVFSPEDYEVEISEDEKTKYLESIASASEVIADAIFQLQKSDFSIYENKESQSVWQRGINLPVIPKNLFITAILADWSVSFYRLSNKARMGSREEALEEGKTFLRKLYNASWGTASTTDKQILDHWHVISKEIDMAKSKGNSVPNEILAALFKPVMDRNSKR